MRSGLVPIEDAVEAFRLAQDKSKGVFRVVLEPSPTFRRLRVAEVWHQTASRNSRHMSVSKPRVEDAGGMTDTADHR
jgi:hypothetical protein